MKTYNIATIPGDGIGKEVVPAAIRVLQEMERIHGGVAFDFTSFAWGSEYYLEHEQMMPDDGLDTLKHFDAIFLGAVGDPSIVPDHISLWELLINIRRNFEQVINIRPARTFEGLNAKLSNPEAFDLIVVRENSEGEYSEVGGTIHQGEDKIAIQNAVFSRKGTERAMNFAFQLAEQRRNKVTSATKSNGITHSMPFWDEVFKDVSKNFPDVQTEKEHIDALAASFVTHPERFDVIVASNLFGDILTDIGAAIMGSVGIAPAADININGKYPSMFEPVHGSAPDIAGKGIANPIGQIWTAKMMVDHFGETDMGDHLLKAIEEVICKGIVTNDIGGNATTEEVTNEIIKQLHETH